MNINLAEVTTRKELKKFIQFPNKLYLDDPYYVPALDMDEINTLHHEKNPAFEHCEARYWLVYKGNEILGRIAAIVNQKHINKWNQKYMRFGWFDFVDDSSVSQILLSAVERWANERNLIAVHGPLGFTDLDREGMLIEGFEELGTFATNYNYPYYPAHLERLGYGKDIDWVEFELDVPLELDPRISRAVDRILTRNDLSFPKFSNKQQMLKFGPEVFELINSEYAHLYCAVPLSELEIQHYIQAYFNFVHPDFIPLIFDRNDKVVAFGLVIPSLSKALQKCRGNLLPFGWINILSAINKNDRADLYLIAVKNNYQGLGLNLVIMDHVCRILNRRKIKVVESNPELETNRNIQSQWKFLDKRQHKRRRCYIKFL